MSFVDDCHQEPDELATTVADLSAVRRERTRIERVDRLLAQLDEYRRMVVDVDGTCPRPLQLRAARVLDAVCDAAAARELVWP